MGSINYNRISDANSQPKTRGGFVNMRYIFFVSTTRFSWVERVCQSICFKKVFQCRRGSQLFFENLRCNVRTCCSYPQPVFMRKKSVSEYMFEQFCFAYTTFVYEWAERVRVYVSKGSSVQTTALDFIFEKVSVQCEQIFCASTTCLLMCKGSVLEYVF